MPIEYYYERKTKVAAPSSSSSQLLLWSFAEAELLLWYANYHNFLRAYSYDCAE